MRKCRVESRVGAIKLSERVRMQLFETRDEPRNSAAAASSAVHN